MSILISNLPASSQLDGNHLLIIEKQKEFIENGQIVLKSIETQKTTLQDIYEWLSTSSENVYNIKTEQVQVEGANLIKRVDSENNSVIIKYTVPDWDEEVLYKVGELVQYKGCLYKCSADTNEYSGAPADNEYWYRIGYQPGKYLNLTEDNILEASGVETWVSGKEYKVEDFVVYNKKLYQCLLDNSDTTWNEDHWQNIGEGNGIIPFKENKYYDKDTIILKGNKLYKRLESGLDTSWEDSHWTCISNGEYSQVYIKYSHNIPQSNDDMLDQPAEYIGIYVGASEAAPDSYTGYNWYKIKGEEGYVNIEADVVIIELELLAEDWSDTAPYTQTVSNENLKSSMSPFIDVLLSDDSTQWSTEQEQFNCLSKAICNNGEITFYCGETKPTSDFKVKLRINGDVNADSFVTKQEFNEFKALVGDINELLEATLEGG